MEKENNCVRICYISMFDGVEQHFDNILVQIAKSIGPIKRVRLLEHPELIHDPSDRNTIAYVEPYDPTKHDD